MEMKDLKGNCPHCHNHCPLSSPNCGRGRAEAEALLAQAGDTIPEPEFTSEQEAALLKNFEACSGVLSILKNTDPGKTRVLSVLLVAGLQSSASIADRSNIRYNIVAEIMTDLEKKGLILREKVEGKKEPHYKLSEVGTETARLAISNSKLSSATLFSVLSVTERVQLSELVEKLLHGWDSNSDSAFAGRWQEEFEKKKTE